MSRLTQPGLETDPTENQQLLATRSRQIPPPFGKRMVMIPSTYVTMGPVTTGPGTLGPSAGTPYVPAEPFLPAQSLMIEPTSFLPAHVEQHAISLIVSGARCV